MRVGWFIDKERSVWRKIRVFNMRRNSRNGQGGVIIQQEGKGRPGLGSVAYSEHLSEYSKVKYQTRAQKSGE